MPSSTQLCKTTVVVLLCLESAAFADNSVSPPQNAVTPVATAFVGRARPAVIATLEKDLLAKILIQQLKTMAAQHLGRKTFPSWPSLGIDPKRDVVVRFGLAHAERMKRALHAPFHQLLAAFITATAGKDDHPFPAVWFELSVPAANETILAALKTVMDKVGAKPLEPPAPKNGTAHAADWRIGRHGDFRVTTRLTAKRLVVRLVQSEHAAILRRPFGPTPSSTTQAMKRCGLFTGMTGMYVDAERANRFQQNLALITLFASLASVDPDQKAASFAEGRKELLVFNKINRAATQYFDHVCLGNDVTRWFVNPPFWGALKKNGPDAFRITPEVVQQLIKQMGQKPLPLKRWAQLVGGLVQTTYQLFLWPAVLAASTNEPATDASATDVSFAQTHKFYVNKRATIDFKTHYLSIPINLQHAISPAAFF